MLKDIETSVGNELLLAKYKLNAAYSYQLNKVAKGGARITEVMKEITSLYWSAAAMSNDTGGLFSDDKADASNLIFCYDSRNKYNTKADVLLQARSFKLHMNTLNNNSSVFYCDPTFVSELADREAFAYSTGVEDPFSPVLMTDKAVVTSSIPLSSFVHDNRPLSYCYTYGEERNSYTVNVYHPIVQGIYNWIRNNVSTLVKGFGHSTRVRIPMVHSTKVITLWSLILAAASPEIVKSRNSSFIDIIDYTEKVGYPFSNVVPFKEAEATLQRACFTHGNPEEPLKPGVMTSEQRVTWMMPEMFWGIDEPMGATKVVMPWYFNEKQLSKNTADRAIYYSDDMHVMSYPTVRHGTNIEHLDVFYELSEDKLRRAIDRMVVYLVLLLAITGCAIYQTLWLIINTKCISIQLARMVYLF